MNSNFDYKSRIAGSREDFSAYGLRAVVVNAMIELTLTKRLALPSGRYLAPRGKIHVSCGPLSDYADSIGLEWRCQHVTCKGKAWPNKASMAAEHPSEAEMRANFEAHCFYAYLELAAVEAHAGEYDVHGNCIVPSREAQPVRMLVLSDADWLSE